MTSVSLDELGPVDYVVVEFPAGTSNFTGEMAAELRALVDSGTIRVIDVLILTKDADGTVEATELSDESELGELQAIEAELAELLAADDVDHLAAAMEPGTTAGVLIWENLGPRRSRQRRGVRVANLSPTGGFPFRPSSPRSRPTKQPQRQETDNGTQTSTRRKSRRHPRASREDRSRGQRRDTRARTGGQDRGRGRGRHTQGGSTPNLGAAVPRQSATVLALARAGQGQQIRFPVTWVNWVSGKAG